DEHQLDLLVGADDKYGAHRGVVGGGAPGGGIARVSRKHSVKLGNLQVGIADQGISDSVALGLFDVDCPFAVVRDGVDAEAHDFAVPLFELLLHARQVTQFGGADGSEVFRMRE